MQRNVEGYDNFLLSGGLNETDTIVTSCYWILLVKPDEVACTPDSNERDTNYNKDASNSHVRPAWVSVLGEEYYCEGWRNDEGWG